jgi:molybdopterin adenylyltransferase
VRAALLTVSSSRASGGGFDESGARMAVLAEGLGAEVAARELVADDRASIEDRLRRWADADRYELVLTSGGTGFAPSDVTPEATRGVIEREAPGLAEAMRLASKDHTPHWMLSRAVAGIRGSTLIVNFPGSPRSILQAGDAIAAALPHALDLIAGQDAGHACHPRSSPR